MTNTTTIYLLRFAVPLQKTISMLPYFVAFRKTITVKTVFGMIFFLLFYTNIFAYSEETYTNLEDSENIINIATSIENRTQQYKTNEYKKIFLVSPYRTGSTYVYNILRYLFEKDKYKYSPHWGPDQKSRKVCKHHDFNINSEDSAIIFTIRNPIESCASLYHILLELDENHQKEKISISDIVEQYLAILNEFDNNYSTHTNCLILRYENFVDNIDYIYEKLESFFLIKIENDDKIFLKNVMDQKNVIANIQKFQTFNESDPSSLLHGNHIRLTPVDDEERHTLYQAILEELNKYRPTIEKWGYLDIFDPNKFSSSNLSE